MRPQKWKGPTEAEPIVVTVSFRIFPGQWPGSFSFQGSSFVGSKQIVLAHTIYFSFVTPGTLGYGDIIPVSGPARALALGSLPSVGLSSGRAVTFEQMKLKKGISSECSNQVFFS
jgi:hypothetical protein